MPARRTPANGKLLQKRTQTIQRKYQAYAWTFLALSETRLRSLGSFFVDESSFRRTPESSETDDFSLFRRDRPS